MHIDIDVKINRFSECLDKLLEFENTDEVALLLIDTSLWARMVFEQTGKTYLPIEQKKLKAKGGKNTSYNLKDIVNMLIHSTQVEVDKKEDTLKITNDRGYEITISYKDFKEALKIFKISSLNRLLAIYIKITKNLIDKQNKSDNINNNLDFSWAQKQTADIRLERKKSGKPLERKDFQILNVLTKFTKQDFPTALKLAKQQGKESLTDDMQKAIALLPTDSDS